MNGLIEQWGKASYASGTYTVPLTLTFTSANYLLVLSCLGTSVDNNTNTLSIKSRENNQFTFMENGQVGSQSGHLWFAIGD
jgi:hypothetical protein